MCTRCHVDGNAKPILCSESPKTSTIYEPYPSIVLCCCRKSYTQHNCPHLQGGKLANYRLMSLPSASALHILNKRCRFLWHEPLLVKRHVDSVLALQQVKARYPSQTEASTICPSETKPETRTNPDAHDTESTNTSYAREKTGRRIGLPGSHGRNTNRSESEGRRAVFLGATWISGRRISLHNNSFV